MPARWWRLLGAGIMGVRDGPETSRPRAWARGCGTGHPPRPLPWPTRARVAATSAQDAVRDADVVITMLPTAAAVESVIFGGDVAAAFAEGTVWAQMGTIGVEATLGFRDRLAAARPGVDVRRRPGLGQQGPGRAGPAAHPGLRPRNRGRPAAPGLRRHRPQDRMARPGRPGQHRQAGRQRLPVHPHRRRRRDHGTRRPPRHQPPAAR